MPWTPVFILVLFYLHPSLGWIAAAGGSLLTALAFANDAASRRSQTSAVAAAGIDGAAIAPGVVSVESHAKNIQHLEGGIIR